MQAAIALLIRLGKRDLACRVLLQSCSAKLRKGSVDSPAIVKIGHFVILPLGKGTGP